MAHISNIASWEISYTLNGGFKWENRLQSVFFHCCVRLPDAISPINQKKVLSSDYGRSWMYITNGYNWLKLGFHHHLEHLWLELGFQAKHILPSTARFWPIISHIVDHIHSSTHIWPYLPTNFPSLATIQIIQNQSLATFFFPDFSSTFSILFPWAHGQVLTNLNSPLDQMISVPSFPINAKMVEAGLLDDVKIGSNMI